MSPATSRPSRLRLLVFALCGLMVVSAALPSALAFDPAKPVVLELMGDSGDAWAFAVRSDDEPTSYKGNEVIVDLKANQPQQRSMASIGLIELRPDGQGGFEARLGWVAYTFQGGDEVYIEAIGPLPNSSEPQPPEPLSPTPADGQLVGIALRRLMDPGEWRYFVVWGAGSGSSKVSLKGEGFTVEKVVEGEGYALGNDELVNGGGIHAHQRVDLPSGTSYGNNGYLGGGVTAVSDTGTSFETNVPLLGLFADIDVAHVCSPGCLGPAHTVDHAARQVKSGGFANISMEIPGTGHVWNDRNLYWLTPGGIGSGWDGASSPAMYEFRVEDLTSLSGPSYRDPAQGNGVLLEGTQVVLSLAQIDYRALEGLEGTTP